MICQHRFRDNCADMIQISSTVVTIAVLVLLVLQATTVSQRSLRLGSDLGGIIPNSCSSYLDSGSFSQGTVALSFEVLVNIDSRVSEPFDLVDRIGPCLSASYLKNVIIDQDDARLKQLGPSGVDIKIFIESQSGSNCATKYFEEGSGRDGHFQTENGLPGYFRLDIFSLSAETSNITQLLDTKQPGKWSIMLSITRSDYTDPLATDIEIGKKIAIGLIRGLGDRATFLCTTTGQVSSLDAASLLNVIALAASSLILLIQLVLLCSRKAKIDSEKD